MKHCIVRFNDSIAHPCQRYIFVWPGHHFDAYGFASRFLHSFGCESKLITILSLSDNLQKRNILPDFSHEQIVKLFQEK